MLTPSKSDLTIRAVDRVADSPRNFDSGVVRVSRVIGKMGCVDAPGLILAAESNARALGTDAWRSLMRLLLVKLRELDIPAQLRPAQEVAECYWWESRGTADDLLQSKVLTWAYLETFPSGQDVTYPDGRLARAMLCVLEPTGDDEAVAATAEYFVDVTRSRAV